MIFGSQCRVTDPRLVVRDTYLAVLTMLDPITALSVACSVLQIVDFAGNLISKGKKYYQSADGALVEHRDQTAAADKLGALAKTLSRTLPSIRNQQPSNEELAIRSIAKECEETAIDFTKALRNLSVNSKHRAWASFRQALKSEWSKDGISSMQIKLASLREQMVMHLLVISRYAALQLSVVFTQASFPPVKDRPPDSTS